MAPRKPRREKRDDPMLAFDVTQEIDPLLADSLRRTSETTLTQVDFDDITIELPRGPKPRS